MNEVKISEVKFIPSSPTAVESGHLGYVSAVLNGALRLDGLALRRTVDGHLTLSFPERRDASGRRHALIRPMGDHVRREIEHHVFKALGFEEAAPR